MLQKTTAQKKIAALKGRYRIVQGGTSSSKTFSIIPLLINHAIQHPMTEISVVAESLPHLKRGAMRDFLKIMEWCNIFNDNNFNRSGLKYTFNNGSFIEFFSADAPEKMKGARRHVLFVNEANNIKHETFVQLAIRTSDFIFADYNPSEDFYLTTEYINDPDASHVVLTYKDNEALDESIVKELEKARDKAATSEYWANWWRVYGLGLVGKIQGLVFQNWHVCKEIPEGANYMGSGLDWGFTNDPTTLIDVYMQGGDLYLFEYLYSSGLTNNDIITRIKSESRYLSKFIIADSAEPKSIAELQNAGISILGAKKGAGSINFTIDILQRYKIYIHESSLNVIKEFRSYKWQVDGNGKPTNIPIDHMNHSIDALRYFAGYYLSSNGATRAFDY